MRLEINAPGVDSTISTMAFRAGMTLRSDLRNLALLLLGFALLVAFISPARNFPVNDDWIYARSVDDLLHWRYSPPDWAQATSLSHIAWGALFCLLFGQSFTVLSIANLAMSVICVLVFYLLLRNLEVTPNRALLASALLGLNPIFLHLSYSFLTDVTFLTLVLAALLFYTRGLKGYGSHWLWLGALATAASYLTRQYGILAAAAPLHYLLLARRWKWQDALAIAALPAATGLLYTLWERTQPVPLVSYAVQTVSEGFLAEPTAYILGRGIHLVWAISGIGIYLLPVMRLPRRPLLSAPIFGLIGFFLVKSGQGYGTLAPTNGNTVDHTGYSMVGYHAQTIWTQTVWSLIAISSALLLSLYAAFCLERLWSWVRAQDGTGRSWEPVGVAYLLALMLAGTIIFLTPSLYDRYWIAVLPLLMLPGLRSGGHAGEGQQIWGTKALALRWFLLAPLAIFSVVGQRDYMEHTTAQWQGAEQLVAQGARHNQVSAGFEWEGWYLYEEGAKRVSEKPLQKYIPFPPSVVLNPEYMVSDLERSGYEEVGFVPYHSWLSGGEERRVLLLRRK